MIKEFAVRAAAWLRARTVIVQYVAVCVCLYVLLDLRSRYGSVENQNRYRMALSRVELCQRQYDVDIRDLCETSMQWASSWYITNVARQALYAHFNQLLAGLSWVLHGCGLAGLCDAHCRFNLNVVISALCASSFLFPFLALWLLGKAALRRFGLQKWDAACAQTDPYSSYFGQLAPRVAGSCVQLAALPPTSQATRCLTLECDPTRTTHRKKRVGRWLVASDDPWDSQSYSSGRRNRRTTTKKRSFWAAEPASDEDAYVEEV